MFIGLLAYDHMEYSTFANRTDESSLEEMTEKAIQLLSQNEKGYFLFVEGGRIGNLLNTQHFRKLNAKKILK